MKPTRVSREDHRNRWWTTIAGVGENNQLDHSRFSIGRNSSKLNIPIKSISCGPDEVVFQAQALRRSCGIQLQRTHILSRRDVARIASRHAAASLPLHPEIASCIGPESRSEAALAMACPAVP